MKQLIAILFTITIPLAVGFFFQTAKINELKKEQAALKSRVELINSVVTSNIDSQKITIAKITTILEVNHDVTQLIINKLASASTQ